MANIHLFFDFLAYGVSFLVVKLLKPKVFIKDEIDRYVYYSFGVIGFIVGAVFFGTLNTYLTTSKMILSKSILGAIFGGIVGIELYKKLHNIKVSTGSSFVLSLAVGIAIGRVGCFFAGLEDFTYGVETTLFWGVDFGDGVKRHPVQLYESFVMFIFFLFSLVVYFKNRTFFEKKMFYIFVLVYSVDRFFLEFLKPYKEILFGLNIFQILCLVLIIYSIKKVKDGLL